MSSHADTRLNNGVRRRMDGAGDGWANAHRKGLGNRFYLQDMDGVVGHLSFAQNTGDRLFMEYVPDNYENRNSLVRAFGVVALFDRKTTLGAAKASRVSTSLYLWLCRVMAEHQPVPPRFFWVIGGQEPPWRLVELDVFEGKVFGEQAVIQHATSPDHWQAIWRSLGLTRLRQELRRVVDPVEPF